MNNRSLLLVFLFTLLKQITSTPTTNEENELTTISPDAPVSPRTRITFGFGLFGRPTYLYTTVSPWHRVRIEAACRTLMTVLAAGPSSQSSPSSSSPSGSQSSSPLLSASRSVGGSSSFSEPESLAGRMDEKYYNDDPAVPRSLFSRNMMDPYMGVMSLCNRVLTVSGSGGIAVRV